MLNETQQLKKVIFDYTLLFILFPILTPIILILILISSLDTKQNGLFKQRRVGKNCKFFTIYKIRTMKKNTDAKTFVTTINDTRITRIGFFLRKYKLDELPQIFNVLKGEMSFVGYRPDVPGFLDQLKGKDKLLQQFLPGVTGLASLMCKDEELLLSQYENPEEYNNKVLWPKKVKINLCYYKNWSVKYDIIIIAQTFIAAFFKNNKFTKL